MRLICSFSNDRQAQEFFHFLQSEGMDVELDIQQLSSEGEYSYKIWVVDEDQVELALKYHRIFLDNPTDPKFRGHVGKAQVKKPKSSPKKKRKDVFRPRWREHSASTGPLTLVILGLCIFVFMLINFAEVTQAATEKGRPIISTPAVLKSLLYDVSKRDEIEEKLLTEYGVHPRLMPGKLPLEGQKLLREFVREREWRGLYREVIVHYRRPELPWKPFDRPMFEKISQGQVWRLVTPCFAHAGILHILFNMLWLIVLGPQMERLMGIFRYGLAILCMGIFSNTCQYLAGGPNFIGYSGIVCGMLGFIWMRQQLAPWEGYVLQPGTVVFVSLFIFGLAGLQLYSFLQELAGNEAFFSGIANTAHIMGGVSGAVLARVPFFRARG